VINFLSENKYKVPEKLKKLTGGGGRIRFLRIPAIVTGDSGRS